MTAWLLAAILTNSSVALPDVGPVSGAKGAPHISDFAGEEIFAGVWSFTGKVTDPDADPSGTTVVFFGVLAGRTATVRSDDRFSLTVEMESNYGSVGAQTRDVDGNYSNIAVTEMF